MLKDNDLADSINSILIEDTKALGQQIKMDADFLCGNNFLDYSLLLFIIYDYGEDMQGFVESEDREENLPLANGMSSFTQLAQDEQGVPYKRYIYFGIIDYITTFNMKKQIEVKFKSVMEDNPSAVKPADYAKRFGESMYRVIGHKE